jgi:hypothetical protein
MPNDAYPLRHKSHVDEPTAADGQDGEWPRKRLVEMDRHFCEWVEHAIERGRESREGAAGIPLADRLATSRSID